MSGQNIIHIPRNEVTFDEGDMREINALCCSLLQRLVGLDGAQQMVTVTEAAANALLDRDIHACAATYTALIELAEIITNEEPGTAALLRGETNILGAAITRLHHERQATT